MDEEIPYNELLVDVDDGIVVALYHYLWMKDGKGRPCPEVNIPHTIVFSNGRPSAWYFTSVKERCIKRKNRANISNATITEALGPLPKGGEAEGHAPETAPGAAPSSRLTVTRPPAAASSGGESASGGRPLDGTSTGSTLGPWPHHGVVARFQGSMTLPHTITPVGGKTASSGRRKKAQLELQDESVEWFTREQLNEVLPPSHVVVHGVVALHEGVLQRFVQPRGQHHFSIRATWSPNACVVERRTNKAKLNDPRVPLQDRLAAWEGPNWLSEHTLITGTVLQGTVCRICDNVAAHLADVSGGAVRVMRMVLYFAVDDANRIWLTHCGTLRTQRPKEMAIMAAVGGGANLAQHPHLRQRLDNGAPLPAALRLHVPDGGAAYAAELECASGLGLGAGAGAGTGSGLDLPEPSPAFSASKASDVGREEAASVGPSSRFLCVLTGEMYPTAQRCEVTYKQLLQHWFSLASQLSNEGDRLRAMDAIPLAIRRANPSLTREWYLRVRSQPSFLYRTAPVSTEAASQLTGVALEELQRSMRPPAAGMGLQAVGSLQVGASVSLSRVEAGPGPGAGGIVAALNRQGTARLGPAALQPMPMQRPVTALAQTLSGSQANMTHHLSRPASRQQPQPSRGPVLRSKSASAAMGAARSGSAPGGVAGLGQQASSMALNSLGQPVPRYMAPIGVHAPVRPAAGPLPSMLLPRGLGVGKGSSGGGAKPALDSAMLQAYGPTPEQKADAAAVAAVLPYEALEEVADEKSVRILTVGAPPLPASLSTTSIEPDSPKARGTPTAHVSHSVRSVGPVPTVAAAGDAGEQLERAPSPIAAAQANLSASGGTAQPWGGPHLARLPSRRNPLRMSASSDITEIGSAASFSEPPSPSAGPGAGSVLYPPLPGGPTGPTLAPTRVSPPRTAGLTLQTIHEEGGAMPSTVRHESSQDGASYFPPPSRGAGVHSVPRMRPPTRGGTDRPPPPGVNGFGRRVVGGGFGHGHGVPHPYLAGSGSTAVAHRSLSESGELPLLLAGGNGANSLNSTMASSVGSVASRRSTSTQALLSNDDIRTLRELSEAYTAAERLTQQLLAQAHEILSEDGGSRAASAGTSPANGAAGRVSASGSGAQGNLTASWAGSIRPVSRYGASEGSAMPRVARQPSSSGGGSGTRGGAGMGRAGASQPPGRLGALGPSPLGQSHVGRQSSDGRQEQGDSSVLPEVPERPQEEAGLGLPVSGPEAGSVAAASQNEAPTNGSAGDMPDAGAAILAGMAPVDMGMLTTAEADLLAEALQG